MLTVGSEGSYEWLVTDLPFDLLQVCPDIVLGKYLAITSIDSGPLVPTEQETADGWASAGKIAYSPRVRTIEGLPRAGWDEWYIFDRPVKLGTSQIDANIFESPREPGQVSVFVNYCFALHRPEMKTLANLFWQQVAWIRPESYVADSEYLNFVSANKALFATVCNAAKALVQISGG